MELHRLGVKILCESANIDLLEFIPIFHRWIQKRELPGVLIDVAEYAHVKGGPGVLLIAHQGNYAIDESNYRRGLVYYNKHELSGTLQQRLTQVGKTALDAADKLEKELKGKIQFRGHELEIFANDRLVAPNTEETLTNFRPYLEEFLGTLYSGTTYTLVREPDPKERFSVKVQASQSFEVSTLLSRLGNIPE